MNENTQKNISGDIKIFHTADLHLGSPFSGLDVKNSEMRRRELVDSFARALNLAKDKGCAAVLIAGDLFDCGYVDSDTVSRTFEILGSCGMCVIISPGNHDPYTEGGIYASRSIPENVKVFDSPEMGRIELPELGLCVHGYAFESERYTADPLSCGFEPVDGYFNIMCAHGDIHSPISTYAPINLSQLGESSLDYVALGHIHKHSEPVKIGETTVAYSGFPEGRSFDECGFGGALIVSLSKDKHPRVSVERVVLSEKRYLWDTLDVSGATSRGDLVSAIKKHVEEKGLGSETYLRITLVGNVDPSAPTALGVSAEEMGLSLLEIRNETLPIYGAEYLENDITLRGALYRQLLPSLKSPDPETRRIAVGALRMGLAALEGRMITS